MFCPHCGHELSDRATMCPYCGRDLPNIFAKKPISQGQSNLTSPSYVEKGKTAPPINLWQKKCEPLKIPPMRYLVGGLLVVIVLIAIGFYIYSSNFFNPSYIKETGTYDLTVGESIYLDSIGSTLEFTSADIESINYDALTLDLNWVLYLFPEKELDSNEARQWNLCTEWISNAYYNENQSISIIDTSLDYIDNYVRYEISTTVNYNETIKSLRCVINKNLDFNLQYTFPFSPEQILMGKADNYLSNGKYDQALELYQDIGTDEALKKIRSINCIDYANQIINYLNISYTPAANLLGMDTLFEFDVESYTFYEHRYLPSYMDSVSGWLGIDYGFGNEYGDTALNGEANMERAKELYDKYFASDGYPDITCTLLVYKSNGEFLGAFSYPESNNDNSDLVNDIPINETPDNPDYSYGDNQTGKYINILGKYEHASNGCVITIYEFTGEGGGYTIDFFLSEESYQTNGAFNPDLEGTFYYMDGTEEYSFKVKNYIAYLYFYMTGDDTAEIRVLNNEWDTIGENEIPVNLIEGTWYRTEEYQSLV